MGADVEIADLAALLEELKGRSGLSYGVLAKRLHLSPSTLHRYCKGGGLPPEFAVVERFARLCGATPDELVELHRRWIAADTAREREREGRVPAPAEPPAPTPAPAAPLAAPPTAPAPAVPPTAPAPAAAFAPPAPPAPWPAPAGPSGGRRRRPALLAGAVALAVVLIAGVLLATRDDGSDEADGSASTGDAQAPAPVTVAARPHAFEEPCGNRYLVDSEPQLVPPPPEEPDAPGWARAMGAVSADQQYIELTIQGTGADRVVLRDLHVRVTRSGDPLPWPVYAGYGACGGGPVATTAFDIDLDAATPEATATGEQPELPLWVDATSPLVVYITARTDSRDVDWHLELDWASGERDGVLRIDDEGQPFHTSASTGQEEWAFPLGGTDWYATSG